MQGELQVNVTTPMAYSDHNYCMYIAYRTEAVTEVIPLCSSESVSGAAG